MSLIVSTVGIEVNPVTAYVKKAGAYTFKLEKLELDGFNDHGDQKFKIFMKCKNPENANEFLSHIENFSLTQNVLWKIKQLEVALKSPETYDIEHWMGRYVTGNVTMREYNGKEYAQIVSYEYSALNDKLDPIPKADANANNASSESVPENVPEIDIDSDEIPFN